MKKYICILLAMLFAAFSPCGAASASCADRAPQVGFTFPASLKIICDGAFEDTAAEFIILPEGVRYIGDTAFRNNLNLTDAYIPITVEYIGEFVFTDTLKLTIHGNENSYAHTWAKEHEIVFEKEIGLTPVIVGRRLAIARFALIVYYLQIISILITTHIGNYTTNRIRGMRPKERPELNPIDYKFP